MKITIYNIEECLNNFSDLINEYRPDKITGTELEELYAETLGYDSFAELDLVIFQNSNKLDIIKEEDFEKELNKNNERIIWGLESQTASLSEVNDQTFDFFKIAVDNDILETFEMRELTEEHVKHVTGKSLLLKAFPPSPNRHSPNYLETEASLQFLRPLIERLNENNTELSEDTIKKIIDLFPEGYLDTFSVLSDKYKTLSVCKYAIDHSHHNLLQCPDYKNNQELQIYALRKNGDIITHIEQNEENTRIAFESNIHSFKHFDSEFQTLERSKEYLNTLGYEYLAKLKIQSEEIIEFALELDQRAAAYVSNHFVKKMDLRKRYYIHGKHAYKIDKYEN